MAALSKKNCNYNQTIRHLTPVPLPERGGEGKVFVCFVSFVVSAFAKAPAVAMLWRGKSARQAKYLR